MNKKIIMALLALIVFIAFLACDIEEAEEESGLPSVYEIMLGVIEAQSKISTYQLDMYMNIDASPVSIDESFDGTVLMSLNGAIDTENGQLVMDMDMIMEGMGEEDFDLSVGIYIVDDVMYMMTEMLDTDPTWIKSAMPVSNWNDFDQLVSQIELLLDAMEVNVIGSEQVKGIDCYVLEIIPEMDQLWQIAMQQSTITGEEMLPKINADLISQMFKDFSVTQWIAKDTYFLTEVKIEMAMGITPETLGFSGENGSMNMDIAMDLIAYNYNLPVVIKLPQGAENAIEMPIFNELE